MGASEIICLLRCGCGLRDEAQRCVTCSHSCVELIWIRFALLPCLRSTKGYERLPLTNLRAKVILPGYRCGYCQNATLLLSSSTSFGSTINMRTVFRVAFHMPACLSTSKELGISASIARLTRGNKTKAEVAVNSSLSQGSANYSGGLVPEFKHQPFCQSEPAATTVYFRTFEYPFAVNSSSEFPFNQEANVFNFLIQKNKLHNTKRLNRPPILFFDVALRDAALSASINRCKHFNYNNTDNNNNSIPGGLFGVMAQLKSQNMHNLSTGARKGTDKVRFLSNPTVLCDPTHVNHSTLQCLQENHNARFINTESWRADFCTLQRARDLILSPSTFGWWAAVLEDGPTTPATLDYITVHTSGRGSRASALAPAAMATAALIMFLIKISITKQKH